MPYIDPYQPKTTTISQPTTTQVQTTTPVTTSSPSIHVVHIPTHTPKISKVTIFFLVYCVTFFSIFAFNYDS